MVKAINVLSGCEPEAPRCAMAYIDLAFFISSTVPRRGVDKDSLCQVHALLGKGHEVTYSSGLNVLPIVPAIRDKRSEDTKDEVAGQARRIDASAKMRYKGGLSDVNAHPFSEDL